MQAVWQGECVFPERGEGDRLIVPDEKLAIQVSYSIKDETTYNREVPPLAKYAKAHEDWKCLLITYDEEGTEGGTLVVPVWKWLMEV